ncbi:hypothetical protein ACO0LV_16850 [Pseudactinotalea sp. Z1739]|uniref:hypothetical protein n=1 Tax=Pseudactinotalea sp. Z1739 TaxID=3413028 RepID=UPI003C7A2432
MRKSSRPAAVLAALALAATGAVATAATASADLVTRCVGTAGEVTVPGDLVVPSGRTCILEGTTVTGQVRVQSGANLVVTDGTLADRVVVASDAYFDATNTAIGANLASNGAYGVFLEGAQVGGHVVGRAGDDDPGFLYSMDTDVEGRIDAVDGAVYLDSTRVGRFVSTEGTVSTDIIDSTIARELTVADNAAGALICASEVDGNASYLGNTAVQVGAGDALAECDEVNYFGADLTVSGNTGGVSVADNIIRGDLTGADNNPAPVGVDNRVRGELGGQFTDLRAAGPSISAQQDARADVEGYRTGEEILTERQDKREAAISEGERIGPAGF